MQSNAILDRVAFLQFRWNEHRVTKGKEAVLFFNCCPICLKRKRTSRKCADEHNQCGFRQMKIRNHRIYDFEFVSGVDKYIRPSRSCLNMPRACSRCLKRADRRCADCDNTPPFQFCPLDKLRRLRGNRIKFAVHHMVFNHIHMNRPKSPQSDMKGDKAECRSSGIAHDPRVFHECRAAEAWNPSDPEFPQRYRGR